MSDETTTLVTPLTLRGLTLPNRTWISAMCQYSAGADGVPTTWHTVHLGQFATGGAGLVLTEATAVVPEGRLSPRDTGLWDDRQAEAWKEVVNFAHTQSTAIGVQLAHAGRKASTRPPWHGTAYVDPGDGGWRTEGPSTLPFGALPPPRELDLARIDEIVEAFAASARRAVAAGFDVVELHAAHGYLLHSFLSPLSNHRTDEYGGSFACRSRLLLRVVEAVRTQWPEDRPLFVRISATDWVEAGWTVDDSVALAGVLATRGVDLIDCSSGGSVPDAVIALGPGYQVPFAARVRAEAGIFTAAVGLITEPQQAADLLAEGAADAVFLGRAALRSPRWPLLAAAELGLDAAWPVQYETARPRA